MFSRRQAFVLLYAVSGAAALVYEITWTRLLTLFMGHTVAAASTVLAAFMGGLAAGSWLGGRIGVRATTWIGVALNVTVAGGAMLLARLDVSDRSSSKKGPGSFFASGGKKGARPLFHTPRPLVACLAIAISGFAALVYEIAW